MRRAVGRQTERIYAGRNAADARLKRNVRMFFSRTSLGAVLPGFGVYVALTIATIWLPSYLERVDNFSMHDVGFIMILPSFLNIVSAPLLGWFAQSLMACGIGIRQALGTLTDVMVTISCGRPVQQRQQPYCFCVSCGAADGGGTNARRR